MHCKYRLRVIEKLSSPVLIVSPPSVVLHTLSDSELIQALVAGEKLALSEIYDRHGDAMYGFALRLLQQPQEAEDLVQEVFVALWTQCTYQSGRGTLKTYLMMLVHSRSIDRLRSRKASLNRQQRIQNQEPTSHAYTPLDNATANELAQRVQVALGDLPENQRQALELAYYQGLTQVEIADRFQVPVGTVKSWFRLSFKKMRRSLEDFMT
ncbi:MAG: sigma-70 family RNA polymerase sigma factor [Alkalinema sp. RU_4_3]|nr:sigma-70 family RNA polymerase sigma factor [Alkalinema sp. RU_4_3]